MPQAAATFGKRRCGARAAPDGSVRWRVWAPRATDVELVLIAGERRQAFPMDAEGAGFFHRQAPEIAEGRRYAYRLDGGPERPDPCSLWQPDGVHRPSAVVVPKRFRWTDQAWKGIARQDLVFYELHVGAFTEAGTFDAIIPRLPELRELGVTAIELLPIGQFPGTRNWGYDGAYLYAAQNSYGGPHGLQRLVDACHAAGLAIFLDVVYNHLGPEGNYLNEFGPYFTDRYKTPWGTAVNYDGPGSDAVRDFVLDNVRMWLDEFHIDGLRLDAVHAMFDMGARHILRAVKEVADDVASRSSRSTFIVAESELNDPRVLLSPERGGYGLDAQWSDDFHHALHVVLTGERRGYYEDFGEPRQVAQVVGEPFLYAWHYSPHRGRKHGAAPPADLLGDRFVVCLQNHDQVGNRARGDRLTAQLASWPKQRLAASLLLLAPYTPLLFMGEEYGEENPFPFFCSFDDPGLNDAVRDGRRREFEAFAWQGEIPDPAAESTFASARLRWSWPSGTARAGLRRLYQDLLSARRDWPALRCRTRQSGRLFPDADTGPLLEFTRGPAAASVQVLCNLSDEPQGAEMIRHGKLRFSSEADRYSGSRSPTVPIAELLPYECVVVGTV